MHRGLGRTGDAFRRHHDRHRRRTAPRDGYASRRRIGAGHAPVHSHSIAQFNSHLHQGRRHAAAPSHDNDDRAPAAAGRRGARRRGLPAYRGVRPDSRRPHRGGRKRVVAVHHGTAAGAAAGRGGYRSLRAVGRLDSLYRHDHRHRAAFRGGDHAPPGRLFAFLHRGRTAVHACRSCHRGRLERRGDHARRGSHSGRPTRPSAMLWSVRVRA